VRFAHARQSDHGYFRALAGIFGGLAVTLEESREPIEGLFAVATVTLRRAEAFVLRRVRARGRA
jgi:hypothetical protein